MDEMEAELQSLLDIFRVNDDLEKAIDRNVWRCVEEGFSRPLADALPPQWGRTDCGPAAVGSDDEQEDPPQVKRVACRVVRSLRAA